MPSIRATATLTHAELIKLHAIQGGVFPASRIHGQVLGSLLRKGYIEAAGGDLVRLSPEGLRQYGLAR